MSDRILREVEKLQRKTNAQLLRSMRTPSFRGWGRGWRAPKTASQYHTSVRYSNRAGKHKSSKSCLQKLAYDFGLNLHNHETGEIIRHGRKKDDINYKFASFRADLPQGARDLELLGNKAYQLTAGRRGDMRQMTDYKIALPAQLNVDQLRSLVRDLTRTISRERDEVPTFAALHEPNDDNENWHMHADHPINHVIADPEAPGGFRLGDRILHEQQAAARQKAGLPKTNHEETRNLRRLIAERIATHMEKAGCEHHEIERWRCGYLPLNIGADTQVARAIARGDVEFVKENFARPATKHEGPGGQRTDTKTQAKDHNDNLPEVSPDLLCHVVLQQVIRDARTLSLDDWQQFQILAKRHGVDVNFTRTRSKDESGKTRYGQISGVQYTPHGGAKLAGKSVNMPLSRLKSALPELGDPFYKQKISNEAATAFEAKLAGQSIEPAIRVVASRLDDAKTIALSQACTNKRAAQTRAKTEPSKTMPTTNIERDRKMDVQALLKEVSSLPPPDQPAKAHKAAPVKAAQPQPTAPPLLPLKVITPSMIKALSKEEKQFLRLQYDYRESNKWDENGWHQPPCQVAEERLDRLIEKLDQHYRNQPTGPSQEQRKRFLRSPIQVDTKEYSSWKSIGVKFEAQLAALKTHTASIFEKAYADPEVFAMLPQFHAKQARVLAQQQAEQREREHAAQRANRAQRPPEMADTTTSQTVSSFDTQVGARRASRQRGG